MNFIIPINLFRICNKLIPYSCEVTDVPPACGSCDLIDVPVCCGETDTCANPDTACTHCDSTVYGCDYDICIPSDICVIPGSSSDLRCGSYDYCENIDTSECTNYDECKIDYGKCNNIDLCIYDCPCGMCDNRNQPKPIVGVT